MKRKIFTERTGVDPKGNTNNGRVKPLIFKHNIAAFYKNLVGDHQVFFEVFR
jgi:hypothetical protein